MWICTVRCQRSDVTKVMFFKGRMARGSACREKYSAKDSGKVDHYLAVISFWQYLRQFNTYGSYTEEFPLNTSDVSSAVLTCSQIAETVEWLTCNSNESLTLSTLYTNGMHNQSPSEPWPQKFPNEGTKPRQLQSRILYGFSLMASTHPRKSLLLRRCKRCYRAPMALTAIGPPTKFPEKPWAKFVCIRNTVSEEQVVCCFMPSKIFEYSNLEIALAAVNMAAGPAIYETLLACCFVWVTELKCMPVAI